MRTTVALRRASASTRFRKGKGLHEVVVTTSAQGANAIIDLAERALHGQLTSTSLEESITIIGFGATTNILVRK